MFSINRLQVAQGCVQDIFLRKTIYPLTMQDDVYLKEDLFPLTLTGPQKSYGEERSFTILGGKNNFY